MKKALRIVTAVVVGILLAIGAGCGKQETQVSPLPPGGKPHPQASGASGQEQAGQIKVKGSDTLLQVAQAWAEEYMKEHPAVEISVTGGGSGTGFAALINGTVDIADASRAIEPQEKQAAEAQGIEPVEHVVAYDGIAIVVNKANPVKALTMGQLKAIFSGKEKDWSAFGWPDGGKIVVLARDTSSGTHVFFKEYVLNDGNLDGPVEYSAEALLQTSNQAIHDEVAQNEAAIGYIGLGYVDSAVKVVGVKRTEDAEAVIPDVETVGNHTYPIARALYNYTRKDCSKLVQDYLEWIKGPKGQEIVKAEGFVPLSAEK